MTQDNDMVECPSCKGEGTVTHCGQAAACWRCNGLGEVTKEEAAKPVK